MQDGGATCNFYDHQCICFLTCIHLKFLYKVLVRLQLYQCSDLQKVDSGIYRSGTGSTFLACESCICRSNRPWQNEGNTFSHMRCNILVVVAKCKAQTIHDAPHYKRGTQICPSFFVQLGNDAIQKPIVGKEFQVGLPSSVDCHLQGPKYLLITWSRNSPC